MNATIQQKDKISTSTSFSAVKWSPELSFNDENIDTQHQKLFELTNELIGHSDADAHSEIINETLYELLKYVDEHFSDEEEMLENINYPKLAEHKKLHRGFTKNIAMFCQDVVKEKAKVAEQLLEFLTAWIVQHTSIDDQDYKNYL